MTVKIWKIQITYEISQKIKNFKAKNKLEVVERQQNLFFVLTIIILATVTIIILLFASRKFLKTQYLNFFKKKPNTVTDIPLNELTNADPHFSPTSGNNATQTNITCFPRPPKAAQRRENAHNSETDNAHFIYEKKVEME